jgi:hypothetical protein
MLLPNLPAITLNTDQVSSARQQMRKVSRIVLLLLLGTWVGILGGCGGGGYAGGGIESLSSSAITIDAGQSFSVTSAVTGGATVSWSLSGTSCSAAACGSVSSATGVTTIYTAPTGITTQLKLTLTAMVAGTKNSRVVSVTVNPAPTIVGTPQVGSVGVAYSTTLTASGGTPTLTLSLASGTLPSGLTFNAATGIISGTPTAAGSYNFAIRLVDSSDVPFTLTVQKSITVTSGGSGMGGNPLGAISGTPPSGTVGLAYVAPLQVSGGTLPYAWSIASGTIPSGLTLSATTGVISGVPTTQGTFTFTVQVRDAAGATAVAPFSVTINPVNSTLGISVTTLPNGTVNVPYSSPIGVSGGTAPYACSIVSGSLPAGLSLGANCVVSGTPTVAGSTTVVIKATDSSNPTQTVTTPVTLTINPPTLSIAVTSLNGMVAVPYSATIGATGGTAPYACTITSGTLPTGLALSANCLVSGTPTVAGTSNVVVRVTDSSNPAQAVSGPVSITILPSGMSLAVTSLPSGTVAVPYSATIPVVGGTAPYVCTITSGILPAGLALSANCLVSGTPTVAGTANLVLRATDSSNPTQAVSGPVSLTIAPAGLSLTVASLPNGTVAIPYSAMIGVAGGTAPYACAITSGTLPAGLALSANCLVSGTPTVAGTANLVVRATDSSNPTQAVSGPVSLTIAPAGLSLTVTSLPNGMVAVPYSSTIGVGGGTAPYACAITSGTLPAGLALSANCLVSGTPTVAGTANLVVRATDSSSPTETTSGPVTLTITSATLKIAVSSLPNGTVAVPYSSVIPVTGGTAPYACSITSGTLPTGLVLSANCLVSGTPTVAGTSNLVVTATDASSPTKTVSAPVTLTINPAALAITVSSLPNGKVAVPYSSIIGVSGGTGPYSCTVTSGVLPAGLTLTGNCLVSGTPTVAGTANLVVRATDSSNPIETTSGPVSLTITPATLSLATTSLPNGVVGTPYSSTIGVLGGTAPYACTITSGVLPAGLALSANCLVSGTPTVAGTANLIVNATDSSSPTGTVSGPVSLTITPAPLRFSLFSLPNGTVGTPYSSVIPVTGGTAPYSCVIDAGVLPSGLALSTNCLVVGVPLVAVTVSLTVRVTDTSNPAGTVTGVVGLTILPTPLTLTLTSLPNGIVGTPYLATVGVLGGTAPYTCSITTGLLPAGLTLSPSCVVSGTPTVAGTSSVTVKATDSGNPVQTVSGPETITITPLVPTLVITSPPSATVNVAYTGAIGVTGGTGPYTCTVLTGTLPAGLSRTNCVISGTPTVAGTSNLTVSVTDSSGPPVTTVGPATLTVAPAASTLAITSPPSATVTVPYTGTIGVTGGVAPYSCVINAGVLPAGLTINGCVISGTPTVAGVTPLTITATDSSEPVVTTTGPINVTVLAIAPLSLTGSLENATVGVAYTQTLVATGGTKPYTYARTAGTLPAGLTLSTTGVISGTPTAPGASSFTVTVTDTETTPQTASLPLVLLVTYPVTPNDPALTGPYAFLFQGYDDAVLGVLAYHTATVGSFTADGAGVVNSGKLDANHQSSAPSGATISSNAFLGTYQIGTDNRGSLTLTTLKADGTTDVTSTYAIALKAPVAPATASRQGDLIQFDGNQVQGTKGSGTLRAQTTTAFAAGLNGSYAFGLQGDSPCLPTCALGLFAGPAAAVGQFNADGAGLVTGGMSDANLGSFKIPSAGLSGTYGDTDSNGRVQLSLITAGSPEGFYPSDYAVYLIDGDEAFVMSTDKHSAYVLLAGSTQKQTQATFSNASMTGAFIGYENAVSNPGLVGATLQSVLNFSTATIFRGVGTGDRNCTITNVDSGGVTSLVSNLTSLGGSLTGLTGLLGSYTNTGATTCVVGADGRGVLQYPVLTILGIPIGTPAPARVYYLSANNRGYFLETGYAALGNLENQTGTPFSMATTFTGTYVYGSAPASSLVSINTSGVIASNGKGNATSTLDLNVGVGTLNILQLGVTGTYNYTAPDSQTGRFMLNGSTVIYAINPDRFVLLDTNPLTTSPSVSVLY